MHVETETKLKVSSLPDVEHRLLECGASFVQEMIQTDRYFDTADRGLTRGDTCLRLRSEKGGGAERLVLAYKGAKQKNDVKRRDEVELQVNDAEATESLLSRLGYAEALVFNKKRRLWMLDGCEVALDELPLLGSFVEIEGPDSGTILSVQAKLGLAGFSHVMESYACLMDNELSRRGQGRREAHL
jgi:adenylate cyclase class 2